MHDWMFEAGGEPLTLPEPQPYAPEDAPWFAATPGGEDDWLTPLFTATRLPDIDVPPPPRPTPGEIYNPGDYGGWDGHDTSEPWLPEYPPQDDDDCPWRKFYQEAAAQVGLFAGVLGALKNSPFTFDPRDDRAIDRALFALDSLDVMLQSQTLEYSTLLTVVSSSIEIVLSEGTDHFAIVLGALAGGAVTGIFDGPIPAGEIIGGIGGAVSVYLAGDRLPTAQIADHLARLILANVDIPPDTPGRRCS